MQTLQWYIQRLRGMSLPELLWRIRSTARDALDRPRFALGLYPSISTSLSSNGTSNGTRELLPRFRVTEALPGAWTSPQRKDDEQAWHERLLQEANEIVDHRFSFFNLDKCYLGDPIDWNRDHEVGKAAPLRFSASIDYRDYQMTGDAKIVWEPNRHHHLVVLGRAYHASREVCYAEAVIQQLESWLQQCPFGKGMQWRSPLELAIRLINWVWAIDLIHESELCTGELRQRVLHAVHLHLWEITRKYSRGSSANNHRIGEAAGVFIATSYFPLLDPNERWKKQSYEILAEEILLQTYEDGGGREQAFGYHLFVLQFFLFAGIVARRTGCDFSPTYWARLERIFEFVGTLTAGGGTPPLFGDYDDGYVLNLGSTPGDAFGLLSVGAVLFNRADFKAWAQEYREPAYWLLGPSSRAQFNSLTLPIDTTHSLSRAFPQSGIYVLQSKPTTEANQMTVLFDCGELGFQSIAAHGHADVLSFTLRVGRCDILVDPGTYDYFRYPAWRNYFRSTRAHNTVMVDDAEQSEMLGPFLWGARAVARCMTWEPQPDGGKVIAEHDGYSRLADPVLHRRTLQLEGNSHTLTIQDEIIARKHHRIAIFFHFGEHCRVTQTGPHRFVIMTEDVTVSLMVDKRLTVQMITGSDNPIAGWVSRRYHHKEPTATVVAAGACDGTTRFTCWIVMPPPATTNKPHPPHTRREK